MDITIALQRAVKQWPHGTAALAARMGLGVSSLLHKVSPTYPTAHASPEEAVEIMEVTGDHGALHAMAARLGYVLLPTPAVDVTHAPIAALADSVREFGEFVAEASTALADGRVSDNERRRIESEGAQALAAIERLLSIAQQLNEQAKPTPIELVKGRAA